MDNSFIQTQHPVVEELLTNKFFGDTLLVCANGHLTDNKLAVGLLFPALLSSDIFALPIENVLLVPDYTMEEIGREFEKLILSGSIPIQTPSSSSSSPEAQQSTSETVSRSTAVSSHESTTVSSHETATVSSHECAAGSSQDPASVSSEVLSERIDQISMQESVNATTVYEEYPTVSLDNVPVDIAQDSAPPPLTLPDYHPGLAMNTNSIDVISSMSAGTSVVNVNIPYTQPQQQRIHSAVVPAKPDLVHIGPSTSQLVNPTLLNPLQVEGSYGTYITLGEPFYTEQAYDDAASDDLKNENNLVIDIDQDIDQPQVTVSNGYSDNCENIQISAESDASIQIYIENNHNQPTTVVGQPSQSIRSPTQKKAKKSVTFKEPEKVHKRRTKKKQKLFIKEYEDYDVDMIENLGEEPEPEGSVERNAAPESPIIEERKPGRPRTKLDKQRPPDGEITRFRKKATEHLNKETYKCGDCGKVLSCQGSLTRHLLVHSDKKPFKCKYCPKAFREAFKKSTHERVHTGSKPYPCKICSKSFRTATQRSVHQNSHTKEKRVQCQLCSQSFAQKYSMKAHMKKFH